MIPDALGRVYHVAYQVNETKTQIQELLEKFGIKPQDGKTLDDQLKFGMLKLCSPAQTSQESLKNMGQLAPSTKGHHFGPEVLHGSTCSPVCTPRAHITQGFGIGQNTEYAIDGSTSCETFVNALMGQLQFQSQTPGHSSGDALTEPLSGMEEDVECTPMPKPNVGHKRVTQKINALSEQDSVQITNEQTPKERGKDEQRYWRGDKVIDI